MKRFLRLEQILTKEQLAVIEEAKNKKYKPLALKSLLSTFNTSFCQCGEVASQAAVFDADGCTLIEKYCIDCIKKENHIKTPEINTFNFDQFFDTIPEYRETLRQRYEELIKSSG